MKIAGKGDDYWLAFGCETSMDISPVNIREMMRTVKRLGKYPIKKVKVDFRNFYLSVFS